MHAGAQASGLVLEGSDVAVLAAVEEGRGWEEVVPGGAVGDGVFGDGGGVGEEVGCWVGDGEGGEGVCEESVGYGVGV